MLHAKRRGSKDGADESKELAELEKLAPRISEYFELWGGEGWEGQTPKILKISFDVYLSEAKEAAESEDSKRLHKELQQRPLE